MNKFLNWLFASKEDKGILKDREFRLKQTRNLNKEAQIEMK